MFQSSAFDPEQPGFNPVHFERAARQAVVDLQRVVGGPAQRALGLRRRSHPAAVRTMSWQALLNVEELAFSNSGFLNRNDPTVVDAFIRLRDSRMVAADARKPSTGSATTTICPPFT
ncbi:hypothetical protein CSX04_04311 [Burkholderia cepacia]|nr:hypothetical protein CSX04_04311 [Burkholderia cepacia]